MTQIYVKMLNLTHDKVGKKCNYTEMLVSSRISIKIQKFDKVSFSESVESSLSYTLLVGVQMVQLHVDGNFAISNKITKAFIHFFNNPTSGNLASR